jgi:hypothetical protein
MAPGDHLKVRKDWKPIYHHGIECCEENGVRQVVHFARSEEKNMGGMFDKLQKMNVSKTSLEEFSGNKPMETVLYRNSPFSSDNVVERAEQVKYVEYRIKPNKDNKELTEFNDALKEYNLLANNCETLAFYIKTNIVFSKQARIGRQLLFTTVPVMVGMAIVNPMTLAINIPAAIYLASRVGSGTAEVLYDNKEIGVKYDDDPT